MRQLILAAALAAVFAVGCDRPTSDSYQNSSGSIALSRDDSLVYAVDTDNEIVAVFDAASQKKVAEVKVGAAPENITVAPDDTIYVTNRGNRSVSVIKKGEWKEAARIAVGVEPTGLAVSPDSKTLYVVNGTSLESAEYGTLTAIDTRSQQIKWEIKVGEEPRGITLTDGGKKALITLFKQGDVVQVDVEHGSVIGDNTQASVGTGQNGTDRSALYLAANKSAITNHAAPGDGYDASQKTTYGTQYSSFHPRAASSITASPDGQTAFMTVQWDREDDIAVAPSVFGGYYANGGPCGLGAVATPGLVTYNAVTAEPIADDITACAVRGQDETATFPPTHLKSATQGEPLQGTVASVVDPTGAWLFVLARESQNVVVMPTARRTGDDLSFSSTGTSTVAQVKIGSGANGIALTRDGKTVYVNNQFDHDVSVIRADETGKTITVATTIPTASSDGALDAQLALGRKLFFTADDSRINNPSTTGVSCNTCHSEGGREDGHIWGFPDGKRQTPALGGRMMSKTAPYHWSGQFDSLSAFMAHTTVKRMGGTGLSTGGDFSDIVAYMDEVPLPDNPNKHAQPTDAQVRGAAAFQKAGCNSCHGGDALTLNTMANVGTIDVADKQPVEGTNPLDWQNAPPLTALNTPSLLGLARTAPYLHNGTAKTLKERIFSSTGDQHGQLSQLSEGEKDDLVEYLKTL